MPQLVKGGKYVFGWTCINKYYRVRIPDETYEEYKFVKNDKLILISGSKTSGGFSLNRLDSIINSKFGEKIIQAIGYDRELDRFNIDKLEMIKLSERLISWTNIYEDKYLQLSESFLERFGINLYDRLLVVRGSGVGPGFIKKGIIYKEALNHDNIVGHS